MSIASRIEEMETHIGDVYDTIDYSYDTTGVNKNIINIPKYLKKGYIDIINNGTDTLYSNFPKVSGIGSNLSLTPTYEAPMKLNEIQGDTLQDGTPTPDSPVPMQNVTGLQNIEVCGKNLFNKQEIIDNEAYLNKFNVSNLTTNNSGISWEATGNDSYISLPATITGGYGMYIEVEENTQYTLSFNSNYELTNYIHYIKGDYTFISRNNSLGHNSNVSFTTPSNCRYIFIRFGAQNQTGNTINITNIQIEKDSTATSYEEYKGQSYEINLGKQLLDESALIIGTFTYDDSGNRIITNNYVSMEFIAVKPNTTYTYSASTPSGYTAIRIASFTGSKTFINRSGNISFTNKTATFTTSSNTYYIAILMYKTTNDADISEISNKQLEKGTKATSYSPYFTPIELGKIGTYQDYIYKSNGNWYLHQEIGKVVLDGSESGWDNQSRGGGVYRGYLSLPNSSSSLSRTYALSNYFYYAGNSETIGNIFIYNSSVFIYTDNTTVQALKTWLGTHNTTVIYALATPEITEITNTELIEDLETLYTAKSQEGTTNISITSEDLEMILNISALRGDVE